MQWRRLLRALTAMVVLPVLATADPIPDAVADCTPPDPELVRGLVDWIGDATGYAVDSARRDPPEIRFCTEGSALAYADDSIVVEPEERGLYDIARRRIHLVAPWQPDNPRDVAVLLHELVHDIQFQNRHWECNNAAEWQAYKLQDQWMTEQGLDAGLDWLRIYMWSRCPRDHHP